MPDIPAKNRITKKQIEALLQYSEMLVVENTTLRAVLNNKLGAKWQDRYSLYRPKIEERLGPSFHTLHALLREGNLPEVVRRFVEEVGTHADRDD